MKIKKWGLYIGCALQGILAHAAAVTNNESATPWRPKIANIDNLSFNSNALFPQNRQRGFDHNIDVSGSDFKLSKRTSGGLFLYKLDDTSHALLKIPALPLSEPGAGLIANSLYGHLLTKVMQRVFVDFAAGLNQDSSHDNSWTSRITDPQNGLLLAASKDWFASATALFNHSWKEFVFNANLSAMHGDIDRYPYASYFAAAPASLLPDKMHNKVSFLQENAELRYRANDIFQPFIDGGLLQVVDYANFHFGPNPVGLGPLADLGLDLNGYKVGGGLALNYKNYAIRLEQQYFQRGTLYHSNLSSLSVKMSVG